MAIKSELELLKGLPAAAAIALINVLFLGLIFFALSSSFVEVSAIRVNLPEVAVESTPVVKLVVTIDRYNKIYFNDQEMDLDTLKEELGRQSSKHQIDTIIIRADKVTPHDMVSKILALARHLNLQTYIAVDAGKATSGSKEVFIDTVEGSPQTPAALQLDTKK